MPIHVSYFGKQNPKTATKPISSYTWDKPPFGQEATVDWKTGKVRSALYQEEKPVDPVVVPLLPFDIKVGVSEKTPVIQVWMPRDTSGLFSRNGYDVTPPEIYTGLEKEGWQDLLLPMDKKATYYVYAYIVGNYTGLPAVEWFIVAVTEKRELTATETRQKTYVLIAIVVNGTVFQMKHGRIDTFYSMPDGETLTTWNKSLEHDEEFSSVQQVQGFNSDTRITSDEVKAATIHDFMMRFDLPDGRAQVSYLDGEGAAEYVFPHGTIIWGRVVPDGSGGYKQYKMTWDLPNRIWVEEESPSDPDDPDPPPPCGHPGNGGGAPEQDHPDNKDQDGGGDYDHPGNKDGENGTSPESGGGNPDGKC